MTNPMTSQAIIPYVSTTKVLTDQKLKDPFAKSLRERIDDLATENLGKYCQYASQLNSISRCLLEKTPFPYLSFNTEDTQEKLTDQILHSLFLQRELNQLYNDNLSGGPKQVMLKKY